MNNEQWLARLPAPWPELLRQVGIAAAGKGYAAYLVGGAVRDLLLGRPVLDIDVVAEGDAVALAEDLCLAQGCTIAERSQFGTVKLEWQGKAMDLVTARSETYHHPGALPTVAPGTIQDDLARRDFAINAMALPLDPARWGELLDPHGGQRDLGQKVIRVLHSRSFQDDATRILRAVRYCARLGFGLEGQTRAWLLRDREKLSTIGGERVFHELELVLHEERPEVAVALAEELGVLTSVHPALHFTPEMRRWFEEARQLDAGTMEVYLCLLTGSQSSEAAASLYQRLKLSSHLRRVVSQAIALREQLAQVRLTALAPSALYRWLEQYPVSAVRAAAIVEQSKVGGEALLRYLRELRGQRTALNGSDLLALGIPEGPEVGRILRRLLEAKLDGLVRQRDDEVALVRRLMAGPSTNLSPPLPGGEG